MGFVQITRFDGTEVVDAVDLADPLAGEGQALYDVSAARIDYADTHHAVSLEASRTSVGLRRGGPAPAASRTDRLEPPGRREQVVVDLCTDQLDADRKPVGSPAGGRDTAGAR